MLGVSDKGSLMLLVFVIRCYFVVLLYSWCVIFDSVFLCCTVTSLVWSGELLVLCASFVVGGSRCRVRFVLVRIGVPLLRNMVYSMFSDSSLFVRWFLFLNILENLF